LNSLAQARVSLLEPNEACKTFERDINTPSQRKMHRRETTGKGDEYSGNLPIPWGNVQSLTTMD
jgi:hypothetical protein